MNKRKSLQDDDEIPRKRRLIQKTEVSDGKLSSEDLELKKIEASKAEFLKLKRKNANYKRILSRNTLVPKYSSKTPTFCQDGPSNLTKRKGERAITENHDSDKEKSSEKPTSKRKWTGKSTKIKPFNLSTDSRAVKKQTEGKVIKSTKKVLTFSEQQKKLTEAIPSRFHTVNHTNGPDLSKHQQKPLTLTRPLSPKFASSKRKRESMYKSTEQLRKEAEDEILNKTKFKARHLPTSVLKGTKPPAVDKRPLTVPHKFHLSTSERPTRSSVVSSPPHIFKALPLPAKKAPILPPQPPKGLTVPVGFKLATSERTKAPVTAETYDRTFKAAKIPPSNTKPFKAQVSGTPLTTPIGFQMPGEKIAKELKEKRQKKLYEENEKTRKEREFHAHQLGKHVLKPPVLPQPSIRSLTTPISPETKKRSDRQKAQREIQLHKEEEEERKRREFKAQEIASGVSHPFKFHPPNRAPIFPTKGPILRSQIRAQKRAEFEVNAALMRQKALEKQKQDKEEQKLIEEEKVKEIRQNLQFKATGVFKPKPTVLKHSVKQLTQPVSPSLGLKRQRQIEARRIQEMHHEEEEDMDMDESIIY